MNCSRSASVCGLLIVALAADLPQAPVELKADLFIAGLEAAGKDPTRASFIARIRTISWDGGGLLPRPVDLSLGGFGKSPATTCAYFAQLKGSTFVPMNGGKPYCGHTLGS